MITMRLQSPKIAIDNAGDVDIEDVSFLKGALIGDSMADHLIERGANGLGIRGLSIAESGGDGACLLMEFSGQLVELQGSHALFGMFAEGIEDFGSDAAGNLDLLNLLGSLKNDFVFF